MVLFLFFCSGATALIYEVVWSKYLSLMFGSTVQAQTVVLAVFMGGLALGNRIVGKRADLLRQPLAAYGYFEAAIGLYAFFFTSIYSLADAIFIKVGSSLLEKTTILLLFKGLLSTSLLLLPTILMGGTLPLLAAWLQKQSDDAGRRSARFYSVNSLGAVFGSLLAGFFLVQSLGLPVTLQMTAMVNVIIALAAISISRRKGNSGIGPASTPGQGGLEISGATRNFVRQGCLLVAMTGAVSMGLEVLSARCLAMIFGASLQAFAIVLISFILGIGLGSAVIASPRWKQWQKESAVWVLLIAAALWIGFLIFNIEGLVDVYRHLKSGLAKSSMGFRFHQLLIGITSLLVLGLPAALLGSVLPIWIRIASEKCAGLGNEVGRLLTWNTLGAVVGVMSTGFVLMPAVGLRGSFAVLASVLTMAVLVLALMNRNLRAAAIAVCVTGLLAVDGIFGGAGWRHTLSSGIFRMHEPEVVTRMETRPKYIDILFYKDAPDASVSVERNNAAHGYLNLRINGKVEASSHGDLSTQYLIAHLPLLMRPESKDVFIVGLGSGITAGALIGHPVEHIVVAENCKPVIEAAQLFTPWNLGVVTNARTRICPEDARTVLKLSPQKYDVIINQPSNPWMAGIGSVFSREFYELAAQRLKPGGILSQWFHVYEMSDDIVFLVVRTFSTVFPHFELWDAGDGDLVLLGSNQPFEFNPEMASLLYSREIPRRQMEQVGLPTPMALYGRQIASRRTAFAIPGPGAIQTDEFPILEYQAPKAFYLGKTARYIFEFDERTWQVDLASKNKKAILNAADDAMLKTMFGEYVSVNNDLMKYVFQRVREGNPGTILAVDKRPMPCIFRPAGASAVPMDVIAGTSSLSQQLSHAVSLLATNKVEGLKIIESALRSKEASEQQPGETLAPYAAQGIKTSLDLGDAQTARTLLELGLKIAPDSPQLGYLARILARDNGGQ